jgi:hypothetical protein
MISMVPGYDKIPHFEGLGQPVTLSPAGSPAPATATGQLVIAPPQTPAAALVENAVVFGGVPLCGYIFLTKKGPAAWLAALLGVGIGWLYYQSGSPTPAAPIPPGGSGSSLTTLPY